MKSFSMRVVLPVLAALCLSCMVAPAQSKGSKSGSSGSGGDSSGGGGSGAPGFSIETEMFTYQAVQANAKVIACDIARYLYGSSAEPAAGGSRGPCTIENASGPGPGIILISSGSPLVQEFQLWRSDMAIMNGLEQRADQACIAKTPAEGGNEPAEKQQGSGIESRGLLSTIISNASPAAAAATSAAGFLSMLGKSQAVTPVVGTVQDPAVLNEVGRQLRALGIQVLIPEMYSPNALGSADTSHSPYMNNLQKLFVAYDKCDKAAASYGNQKEQAVEIIEVIKNIESFLTAAFATAPAQVPDGNAMGTPGANTASAGQAPRLVSHFTAALAADDMAREMGFTANGTPGGHSTWQHLMWLQALESGGSVEKSGGLFGTKVYFGGGAVDTYSVFRLDGQLVCSGNVYNFQAPVKMDSLQKTFEKEPSFDAAKSPLLESSCGTLPPE